MAKSHQSGSTKSAEDASKLAKGTQRPGQTKEQTRLIAQGIHKGIEEYKKQHKLKARELDKALKKVKRQIIHAENSRNRGNENAALPSHNITEYKQHWLPWVLLGASWAGFIAWLAILKFTL